MLKFFKKSKKTFTPDYFKSLDELPISNWLKLNELNDYGFLLKKYQKIEENEFLFSLREHLVNELIDKRGISTKLVDILKKEIEIAKYQNDYVISGDKINITFINIAKEELKELNKSIKKTDNIAIQAYVDSGIGFQIDLEKTSVLKFYAYIDLINKKQSHNGKN